MTTEQLNAMPLKRRLGRFGYTIINSANGRGVCLVSKRRIYNHNDATFTTVERTFPRDGRALSYCKGLLIATRLEKWESKRRGLVL